MREVLRRLREWWTHEWLQEQINRHLAGALHCNRCRRIYPLELLNVMKRQESLTKALYSSSMRVRLAREALEADVAVRETINAHGREKLRGSGLNPGNITEHSALKGVWGDNCARVAALKREVNSAEHQLSRLMSAKWWVEDGMNGYCAGTDTYPL